MEKELQRGQILKHVPGVAVVLKAYRVIKVKINQSIIKVRALLSKRRILKCLFIAKLCSLLSIGFHSLVIS